MRINSETLTAFRQQYKAKVGLLLVLYLLSPKPDHLALPSAITSSVPSTPSHDVVPVPQNVVTKLNTDHVVKQEAPLTPPYEEGDRVETTTPVRMTVKGSTSQDSNTSSSHYSMTPPLSSPPAPLKSSVAESRSEGKRKGVDEKISDEVATSTEPEASGCPIDYRGRPLCPDSTRTPLSIAKRSTELADAAHEFGIWVLTSLLTLLSSVTALKLSPLFISVLLLHALYLIELLTASLEDEIVKIGLENPSPSSMFQSTKSFKKRLSRLNWRVRNTVERYGKCLVYLSVMVGLVALVVRECWSLDRGKVPFLKYLGDELEAEAKLETRAPFREVIFFEAIIACLTFLQPLKHLLPPSLLPPTVAPPAFLFPSPDSPSQPPASSFFTPPMPKTAPSIHLSSLWLLSNLIDVLSAILILLETISVILVLPTYSPLTLSFHVIGQIIYTRVCHIISIRQSVLRTLGCLRTLFMVFPEGDGKDEDSVCTICFEDVGGLEGKSSVKTENAACKLPCGHRYHAGCLVSWCYHQDWCPICRVPLTASAPLGLSHELSNYINTPNLQQHDGDVFPGNVRRRIVAT